MNTPQVGDVLHVEVTERDILDGARCECEKCPTALALKRLGFPYVVVEPLFVVIVGDDCSHQARGELPEVATAWILWYDESDDDEHNEPYSFDITIRERHPLAPLMSHLYRKA